MRVVWGEMGKRAGAGVSVGERMRTEAIWSAGVLGKYRRAGGGANASGAGACCERLCGTFSVMQLSLPC